MITSTKVRPGRARAECTVRVEEKIKGFRANEVSSIYSKFSETNETTLVNEYTIEEMTLLANNTTTNTKRKNIIYYKYKR